VPDASTYLIDLSAVTYLGMAYAWEINRFKKHHQEKKQTITFKGTTQKSTKMLALTTEYAPTETYKQKQMPFVYFLFNTLGFHSVRLFYTFYETLYFLGMCVVGLGRALVHPRQILLPNVLIYIDKAGITAIPIILLTSFVIGVVLSYEGAVQLTKFGAKLVTINLLGYSILREAGVLVTAVVIAGRSGSAFAAEIGTMKVNEEVDAMKIMGINPLYVLVIPRIMALIIFMPVLTLIADFMGLFGGAIICYLVLDINFQFFFLHLQSVMDPASFWVGIAKAPLCGLIIGLIGCLEGLKVTHNAKSVGEHTTKSVVKAIFLVIIVNGIISVLMSYLGI